MSNDNEIWIVPSQESANNKILTVISSNHQNMNDEIKKKFLPIGSMIAKVVNDSQLEQVYASLNNLVYLKGTTIGFSTFGFIALIIALLWAIYGTLKMYSKYKGNQDRQTTHSENQTNEHENIELMDLNCPVQQNQTLTSLVASTATQLQSTPMIQSQFSAIQERGNKTIIVNRVSNDDLKNITTNEIITNARLSTLIKSVPERNNSKQKSTIKCDCSSGCASKQYCKCKKANVSCNSLCHSKKSRLITLKCSNI